MFKLLLKPLTLLPLSALHRIGIAVGHVMHLLMTASKQTIRENMLQSGLFANDKHLNKAIKANVLENGKHLIESLAIWQKPHDDMLHWVKPCKDWHIIETALAEKKGIIFLTPHMGCFEITSIFYGAQHPITVLYRRPKMQWLHKLTITGRTQNYVKLAPANLQGVRVLMQALKHGEAVGMLPDQTPGRGEGEWVPFFGKPAYTMTLASKLAQKTGAAVIMAFGERLPDGKGFNIHLTRLESGAIATPALLNQSIEKQIATMPTQYLWHYPRYRIRKRALKRGRLVNSE